MKQVIAHLHEVHDCKKFWLLVGAQDNYESSCRLQGMLDYAKEHKIKIDKDDIWYGSLIIRADWKVINIYGTGTRSSRML